MSEKCQKIFDEILTLVPTADFSEIKKRRGGKLRYPIYINENANYGIGSIGAIRPFK